MLHVPVCSEASGSRLQSNEAHHMEYVCELVVTDSAEEYIRNSNYDKVKKIGKRGHMK